MHNNTVNPKPEWLQLALEAAQQNAAANAIGRDPHVRPHLESSALAGLVAMLAAELSRVSAKVYVDPRVRNRVAKLEKAACSLNVDFFPASPRAALTRVLPVKDQP